MLVIEAPQQRRASLAVLAGGLHLADSAAADETQNQGKQNRTHDGDHNADEHALLSGASDAESSGGESPHDRTDEADEHVHEEAKS